MLVTQSCLTLCHPMDCGPPGSAVHVILQARILDWLPFPSPVYLPNPETELLYSLSHQGSPNTKRWGAYSDHGHTSIHNLFKSE